MSGSHARRAFAAGIPKADLHCHLEGVIDPATAIDLAGKNGVGLPFDSVTGAREFLDVGSLEAASALTKTLQTAADVERVTVELAPRNRHAKASRIGKYSSGTPPTNGGAWAGTPSSRALPPVEPGRKRSAASNSGSSPA